MLPGPRQISHLATFIFLRQLILMLYKGRSGDGLSGSAQVHLEGDWLVTGWLIDWLIGYI